MLLLAYFSTSGLFSQTDPAAPFNASFYNAYADKLQLTPKERLEFISAHRKVHLENQAAARQATQQPQSAARGIGGGNTTFAGPCVNADFELGNISGWTGTWGYNPGFTLTPACCPTPGGQQTIMSGAANDPYGPFPVVCPGGTYSLRLGNNGTGGQADRIEQTFLVSPSNANFSYKYAVVFQDPNHTAAEQPYFEISLIDALGTAVPCTFYHVAAGGGIPGFFNSTVPGSTDVIYKPWSTVLVDLTPYIGQNITIRFSTFDCSLGGHFGYAYIDGVCQSFNSGGSATVCAGASTTFCAPGGVSSYTWNGPGLTNFAGQCATASAPGIYTVTTTLFTGCSGPVFTYTLENQAPPVANAGGNATVCVNNNTVSLSGSITGFTSTPVWSSSGSGVFTSTANLNTAYTPSPAELTAGSVTLTLKTAGNGVCPVASNSMVVTITPSPVVNAGTGGSTCNSNPFALNGSVTAGATTGTWSTSGNGTFSSISALNASYTPGPADITAGSVTLTLRSDNNGNCFPDSDTIIILVRQPPTANAGANQSLCSTTPTIALSGIIGGGTSTGTWSSSGSGAFTPATPVLNKVYAITPADIAAGAVIFTLTSTNNGPCPAATDTVKMQIIRPATVTAGPNQFLCSTSGSINLAGAVTSLSNTGTWSVNGTGLFNPGASSMNTGYSLTPADITAGTLVFTLTSNDNGPCAAVSDTVKMRIRIPGTANAGANQVLCSNAGSVNLAGTIGGGSSAGSWSASGVGAFAPSSTVLTTAYAINAADIALGSVIFTLTSTGNGPCAAVQDTVMMTVIKIATLTAGPNQIVCSTGSISLAGIVNSPSNTVIWSSGGSGSFLPSASAITPTYNLNAADITAGNVTFTISSTNNGPCPVVRDSVMIAVKKLAVINAGTNQNICSNSATLNLSGTIGGGATTTTWTSSGIGGFLPNATSLNTSYGASLADINSGTVIFTLTSTNNGPCPAVSDTVMMAITKIATVTAGPNLFVCSSAATLNLAGSVNSPSNTANWGSNGSGSFIPNAGTATTTYSFSTADITAGTLTFTLSSTNNGVCPAVNDTVKMKIMKLAAVNAGTNQALCSNISSMALTGTVTGASGTAAWSTNGAGAFVPGNTSLNTAYSITAADIGSGQVIFTLSSTGNGPCPVVTNTVALAISKIATVSAGPNQFVCSDQNSITLNGTVVGVTSAGQWGTSATGNFLPGNTTLAGSYSLTTADITSGVVIFTLTSTGNGVCPAVSDTVKMKILRLAAVNAGTNQALCSNISTMALTGTVTGASGTAAWSTNGAGSFAPNTTSLNTTYAINAADISSGQVIFTLSSTGNGPCPVVTNTVALAISKIATVSAGPNQFVCSSQNSIALNGTVTGVTSAGQWGTSATGNFLPGNTTLAGSYSLTPADITSGVVIFTLTSTGNGVCPAVSDTVKMKIMKLAAVNAGTNQALCSNISTMALAGTVTGASGTAAWSTNGAGTFVPNTTSLNTTYAINAADISIGQVIFTLSSTGNGPCPVVTNTVALAISKIATVSAGPNQFVCSSQNSITLNGTVAGVTSAGQWGTSATGNFIPGNTTLAGSYSLTPADVTNGVIVFTLTSTGNGVCPAVSDTVKMKILRLAAVNAGTNQARCSNISTVALNGIVTGASGTAAWSTNGAGTFAPNTTSLNTTYAINAADISSGQVIFTLSSTGNGPCPVVTNTVALAISKIATVSAGPNQFVCSAQNSIALNGNITGVTSAGQWGTSGTGSFTPNNTALAGSYVLSPVDINNGVVVFTLASTNNGVCPVVRDTVKMKIMKQPTVSAGQNQFICSNQGTVTLTGIVNGGSNSRNWSTSGGGTFIPNAGVLTPSYVLSAQDISAGIVTFTLSSQNSSPCPERTDATTVTITTPAQVIAGPSQTICSNTSVVNLSGSITGGQGSVSWISNGSGSFNPGHTLPVTAYALTPSDFISGFVNFTLVSTNNNNCPQSRSSLAVLIKEKAHVNAGADKSICSNQALVQMQGVITGVTNNGTWAGNGTGTCSPNQPAGSYSISAADISQGSVMLVLTSSDNDVCPAMSDTMMLNIVTRPKIAVSADTTVCERHAMIALSSSVTGGSGTPQWTTSGSGIFLPVSSSAATHYSLSSSDMAGGLVSLALGFASTGPCGYTGSTMQVHVLPAPHAAFSASAYTLQLPGDPIQFTNSSTSSTISAWSFGDGESSSLTDPSHNYATVGFYRTVLIVKSDNGCTDTTDRLITVISDVKFPTAFTPNAHGGNGGYYDKNDYSNDVFFPYTLGVEDYDLMIFNRWGELIFKSTDVKIGWDGYFNGKLCQQDVYVYKLNLVFFDGRKYNKTGSVTLLR